jgi:hypothetical protein
LSGTKTWHPGIILNDTEKQLLCPVSISIAMFSVLFVVELLNVV